MTNSFVFRNEALLSTICDFVPHWEVIHLEGALTVWIDSGFFEKYKSLQTPLMEFILLRDKKNEPFMQRLIHLLDADSFLNLAKAIPSLANHAPVVDLKMWNDMGCPTLANIYEYDDYILSCYVFN